MLELTYTPSNIGMNELVTRLKRGLATRIILEPGDATRYELMIIPQSGLRADTFTGNGPAHLVVVRQVSSTLFACHLRKQNGPYWPGDFSAISNNNEHSANVLALFFEHLMPFLDVDEE
jgi:hypothetical protein